MDIRSLKILLQVVVKKYGGNVIKAKMMNGQLQFILGQDEVEDAHTVQGKE